MFSLHRIKYACFLVLVLFFSSGNNVFADPAIWKIDGENNTVYLFGSIHVANNSMYPLGEKIENAFKQADVLVVEVDEVKVDQVKLQEIMMSKGFYPGAETIKDHVSEKTFKHLQTVLTEVGIPYFSIARMKPGILAMTLTIAKIVKMGYSPELGIDRHFMQRARGSHENKEVNQLESMEKQMDLLLSFSDDDMMLKHTLISLEELPEMVNDLMNAWNKGDEKQMEQLMRTDQMNEYPEFENILKRLIDDRNVTMATKIQEFLQGEKNYFIVVGAGHLVGDKGIVSLLKQKDVSVQRQ